MATNWPQQVNPRACRSALCVCTADWNSKRENNCRSCENILLTRVKADPPSLKSVAKPDDNLSEAQPFFGISFQIVIWTRVIPSGSSFRQLLKHLRCQTGKRSSSSGGRLLSATSRLNRNPSGNVTSRLCPLGMDTLSLCRQRGAQGTMSLTRNWSSNVLS